MNTEKINFIFDKIRYNDNNGFQFEKLYANDLTLLANLMIDNLLENGIHINKCTCLFTTAFKGINLIIPLALRLQETFATKPIKISYIKRNTTEIIGQTPCDNDNIILIDDVFRTGFTLIRLYNFIQKLNACNILASAVIVHSGTKQTELEYKSKTNLPLFYLKRYENAILS